MRSTPSDDYLMTYSEVAAYLRVKVHTVYQWVCTGRVKVPFVRLTGKTVRFRKSDIDRFLAERQQS